jgi:hypothetical protein
LDTVRRFALSLPETTEEPHFDKSSFRVRGKVLATVPPDERHVHVHVDPAERAALLEAQPDTYEAVGRGVKPSPDWVRVNLDRAQAREVKELLQEAWLLKAPKRVAAAFRPS